MHVTPISLAERDFAVGPLRLAGHVSPLRCRSRWLSGGPGAAFTEPPDQRFPARVGAACSVQRGRCAVVGSPVQVGSAGEQVSSHPALAAMACLPEGVIDRVRCGRGVRGQELLDTASMPSAAACHRLPTRAPRSASRRATCQQPCATASSNGVPPRSRHPGPPCRAPPSISASARRHRRCSPPSAAVSRSARTRRPARRDRRPPR